MVTDHKISTDNPFWGIIQDAYKVFSVPIPIDLEVCNACCMPDALQDEMKTYGSSNIPLRLMKEWYSSASNYPISQNLWCYILPRVLEFLTIGEVPTHSLEIVMNRYPTGQKVNWSEAQWQVLDAFQKKYLQTLFKDGSGSHDYQTLDEKLCMFANSAWEIDDLFEQVYNLPINTLIAALYDDWIGGGHPQIWVSAFWNEPKKIELKWTAKNLHDRLFEYGMAPDSPKPLADKALDLVDAISIYPKDWENN